MDEGRGRAAYDRSENHINCWFRDGPEWTTGRFGSAVQFAANGGCLACVKDPKLDLGTEDFTISLWFKGPSANGWRWLLAYNGQGTASNPALVITTCNHDGHDGAKLRITLGKWWTEVYDFLNNTTTLNSDTDWYHIAFVRNGTMLRGYVNGARVFSKTQSIVNLALNDELLLGRLSNRNTSGFHGAIDDVAIWKQALTASQVKTLADGTATPLNVLYSDLPRSVDGSGGFVRHNGRQEKGGDP